MEEKRYIQLEDLYKFVGLEGVTLSPDGTWGAFVHNQADQTTNGYQRNIWLIRLSDGDVVQLTRSGKDSQPSWALDSASLLFVSSRGGKAQVYRISVTVPGGEAYQVTDLSNGVSGFRLSPDGQKIVLTSGLSAIERHADENDEIIEALDEKRFDPRIVTNVPYRSGTSYHSDRYAQVFVGDVSEGEKVTNLRRLTDVDANHSVPFWSTDGNKLFTDRSSEIGADEPGRHTYIHVIDIASGEIQPIMDELHVNGQAKPSPDGKSIAYQRYPFEKMSLRHDVISLMDASTYAFLRDLNHDIDRATVKFMWSDSWLYILVQDDGRGVIYRVQPDTGISEKIINEGAKIIDFDVASSGDILFSASRANNLQELYLYTSGSGLISRLTSFNQSYIQSVKTSEIQSVTYTIDGRKIQGWYLLPSDYVEGQPVPLIVNVHGGPHVMWGAHDENKWHEWQYYAANGYAVFYCNPRGSGGYGNAFQESVFAAWGDAMQDVLAGVDLLIEKGVADPDRLVLTGGSYGGYLTTWMLAHTDRFKAAVTQRGVYNLVSFFGTTDIPSFVQNEFGYTPLENPEFLWKHSPLAYAQNITAPVLILHSENDFRVPISEAEQLFGYLRRAGKTVEFVRYPREGHELSRSGEPQHRIDRLKRILDWFNIHLS